MLEVVVHPLILTLGRQKQVDLCKFQARLVYRERPAREIVIPCLKININKQIKINIGNCVGAT